MNIFENLLAKFLANTNFVLIPPVNEMFSLTQSCPVSTQPDFTANPSGPFYYVCE